LAREWNDLAEAERLVMEGIELVRDWSEAAAIDGYAVLSRLRLAQGDAQGSQAAADRAQQLAFDSDATQLDDMFICLLQARQQAMQGNIEAALDWVERSGGDPQGRSIDFDESLSPFDYHLQHHQHLTVVRIWIVEQRYDRALERLDQLLAGVERFGWLPSRRAIEVYVLKAVTLQALGRVEQALIVLDAALAMAEPGGYIRTFVDEGPPMAKLLREAASRGVHPEYVSRLSAALVSSEPLAALVEPLSEREREILQLIAEGLTNRQIADRLVLAIGTVKAHTSSIYGKLGVANRVQAVARARELKLLA
jgi:LuxR family maltose regulon positive regulatory protein